jgi:hypothetical protein
MSAFLLLDFGLSLRLAGLSLRAGTLQGLDIDLWSQRNDSFRVVLGVRVEVVLLDVYEVSFSSQ